MTTEIVIFEQAVQKLPKANSSNNAQSNSPETNLTEIHDSLVEQSKNTTNLPQEIVNMQEKMTNHVETIYPETNEGQEKDTRM